MPTSLNNENTIEVTPLKILRLGQHFMFAMDCDQTLNKYILNICNGMV